MEKSETKNYRPPGDPDPIWLGRRETAKEELEDAIEKFADERYKAGFEEGLKVAKRICDWMNIQPPTRNKHMHKVRKWGLKAIEEASG